MNGKVVELAQHPARESWLSFLRHELKPRAPVFTTFNVISVVLMLASAVILGVRFYSGLASVSNLSQIFPWGLWKGFCVITGVAFAGGAYVVTFLVYVVGLEKYRPIVRITVLNGFLAYVFYAGALLLDLGRPWNVINPVIGNSFGFTSVLFLVAWHFMLYMGAQAVELSPAFAEWFGARRIHRVLEGLTLAAVIFGITLSTLHQSGLGALYLMAKPKIHPLWYSEFIPLLFFVSSIFGGLAIVMLQGTISNRIFRDKLSLRLKVNHEQMLIGLARICAGAMLAYLFLQVIAFVHERNWQYFSGGWAAWWLVELVGLVALPMVLFAVGAKDRRMDLIRAASVVTVLGILANRLNISIIAYNWNVANHYVPSWQEFVVAAAVVCAQIWVFRWLVWRLPIVSDPPLWARHGAAHRAEPAPTAASRLSA